jgi:plastocyanin
MLHPRTRLAAALAAVLLAATAAGCSGNGQTTASAPASAAPSGRAEIVITNFAYQPANLTVSPGQRVTVVNRDSTAHTLTATGQNAFDTGKINPGATGSFTAPNAPGTYPYICTIHQFMHGTLTVRP